MKSKQINKITGYENIKNYYIIYESSCEASRKLKINQSNISACCLGKRKIAGGYHWKYINEREEK